MSRSPRTTSAAERTASPREAAGTICWPPCCAVCNSGDLSRVSMISGPALADFPDAAWPARFGLPLFAPFLSARRARGSALRPGGLSTGTSLNAAALQLRFDLREPSARLADAPNHANQFRAGPFALHSLRAPFVFRENFAQPGFVAALVRFVGLGHQLLALGAVGAIGSKVGMNALGHFAIQALHFGRRFESARRGFGFFSGRRLGFGGACASFPRGLLRALVRGLVLRQALGDRGLQFVQFRVARADVMQILPLERAQFGAQICGPQFALGEFAFDRGLFLAFARKLLLFWI